MYWLSLATPLPTIVAALLRYKKAQAVLFGPGIDLQGRFDAKADQDGVLLLNKLFEIYQDPGRTAQGVIIQVKNIYN